MRLAVVAVAVAVAAAASVAEGQFVLRSVTCENKAFAPPRLPSGQFTTGGCDVDSDCIENCCDANKKCRAPLALTPGLQFCGNGYSPLFFSPSGSCTNPADALLRRLDADGNPDNDNEGDENEDGIADALNDGQGGFNFVDGVAPIRFEQVFCRNTDFAPTTGPGSTVPTQACGSDEACLTGCCDGAKCRVSFALKPGQEFCRNGFSPQFNGIACASVADAIGVAILGPAEAGTEAPTVLGDTPSPSSSPTQSPSQAPFAAGDVIIGFTVPDCRNQQFAPLSRQGGQFTTGPCEISSDCQENCCDLNGKCRGPRALTPGVEFCQGSGFTPIFFSVNGDCSAAEAFGDPIRANDVGAEEPEEVVVEDGNRPIAFTVVDCLNLDSTPGPGSGNAGPTAPCNFDDDCSQGCCDFNGRCRVPLALKSGEFCRDSGFQPVFTSSNGPCGPGEGLGEPIFADDVVVAAPTDSPTAAANTNAPTDAPTDAPTLEDEQPVKYTPADCANIAYAPPPQPGDAPEEDPTGDGAVTSVCNIDSECQSNCCDLVLKLCVASPLDLSSGAQWCTSGWSPKFTGAVCENADEAIGDPVLASDIVDDVDDGSSAIVIVSVVVGIAVVGSAFVVYRKRQENIAFAQGDASGKGGRWDQML